MPYHQDERLADGVIPLPVAGEFLVLQPDLPGDDVWARMAALHSAAADQIAAAVRAGGPTTVLSGDCLVAMAALAGSQRAGVHPGIVWFDAHGDVHTLQTSTSGYLGGLSLRLVLGAHPELLAEPAGPAADHRGPGGAGGRPGSGSAGGGLPADLGGTPQLGRRSRRGQPCRTAR